MNPNEWILLMKDLADRSIVFAYIYLTTMEFSRDWCNAYRNRTEMMLKAKWKSSKWNIMTEIEFIYYFFVFVVSLFLNSSLFYFASSIDYICLIWITSLALLKGFEKFFGIIVDKYDISSSKIILDLSDVQFSLSIMIADTADVAS